MDRCQPKNGQYVFQVPAIASDTGFSLLEVQQELQRLQVKGKFLEYVAYLLLLFSTMFPVTHFCTSSSCALKDVPVCPQA